MKVTLLQSVWGEKCCGTEHSSVPACHHPSRYFVFCLVLTTTPLHVLTTALQLVFEMLWTYFLRGKDRPQTNINFRSSAMDHVVFRRPLTTEAEFDPGRSSAVTGFAPSVIPPMPHTHLHLTTTPIRSRSRRDLGNFEIQGVESTTVLAALSSFEL